MRKNRTLVAALILGAMVGAAGCNAISFFPRDAAEKAADKVLDEFFPGDKIQESTVKPAEPKAP